MKLIMLTWDEDARWVQRLLSCNMCFDCREAGLDPTVSAVIPRKIPASAAERGSIVSRTVLQLPFMSRPGIVFL